MIRISLIAIACLIALLQTPVQQQGVESLLNPVTQTESESSQTPDSDVEDERIEAEVAEIMAIRKQLGGGVAETLGDLSLEMPGNSNQQKVSPQLKDPVDLQEEFAKLVAAQSRQKNALLARTNTLATPFIDPAIVPSGPTERQGAVRQAARMLEEAAAILEEAREYDHADQVRKSASDLWRTARKP